MGKPLSPDHVFDFHVDEPEPHPAYDFFAPGPLPGYAGNPNNNNGWIEADVPLLGELGVVADEPMVGLIVDEIVEPIVGAEEQGFDEEEVWEVNEEWLMAPVTPPPMPAVPPPSIYEVGGPSTAAVKGPSFPNLTSGLLVPPSVIEDLSTRLGNLEYRHRQLVKKVIQVSDAEVAAGFAGSSATERYTDSTAVDYSFRDEQPGEHADAVHFGDGYATFRAGEETSRTSVVLLVELSYRGCKPDTDTEKRSS
ncbi:hypothetical protein Tco_1234459 [Tanacetum coccineum]